MTEFRENGSPVPTKALAYVDDWIKGVGILTAYHNGTFRPGQELPDYLSCTKQKDLINAILADYNFTRRVKSNNPPKPTFSEVYERFFEWKFVQDKSKQYSKSSVSATKAAYKRLPDLHDRDFASLRHADFQAAIDACDASHATAEHMLNLIKQVCKYAVIYDLCDHDYSEHVRISIPDDDEQGVPFNGNELSILWGNRDNDVVEFVLIMCYSGFRILAYKSLDTCLSEKYFKGGVKTKTSKQRIVPIHSAILPLVERRINQYGELLPVSTEVFRRRMYSTLSGLGIDRHTPHDCRHTFSMLCERYGVNDNDRKRMLGHSFGSDVTNRVYGHRGIEDLRSEIEKIPVANVSLTREIFI